MLDLECNNATLDKIMSLWKSWRVDTPSIWIVRPYYFWTHLFGNCLSGVLDQFVKEYFNVAGSDLIPSIPKEFNPSPPNFLRRVQSLKARKWALQIHKLWLDLIWKVSPSVAENSNLHTLVPLSRSFVIPGSRFREAYYWDSYWVIKYVS